MLSTLGDDAREEAFQILGQYIRSKRWTLWFTEIVVSDGKDDVATCFFKASPNRHLVLMLAFQDDAWVVTAYEIPERPWARVHGETMEEYVSGMVAEAREQGEAWHKGPLADGLYLLPAPVPVFPTKKPLCDESQSGVSGGGGAPKEKP